MCTEDTIYSIKDGHLFELTINPVSITCLHFNNMLAVTQMCKNLRRHCSTVQRKQEHHGCMHALDVQTLTSNLVEGFKRNFFDWDQRFYSKN